MMSSKWMIAMGVVSIRKYICAPRLSPARTRSMELAPQAACRLQAALRRLRKPKAVVTVMLALNCCRAGAMSRGDSPPLILRASSARVAGASLRPYEIALRETGRGWREVAGGHAGMRGGGPNAANDDDDVAMLSGQSLLSPNGGEDLGGGRGIASNNGETFGRGAGEAAEREYWKEGKEAEEQKWKGENSIADQLQVGLNGHDAKYHAPNYVILCADQAATVRRQCGAVF